MCTADYNYKTQESLTVSSKSKELKLQYVVHRKSSWVIIKESNEMK